MLSDTSQNWIWASFLREQGKEYLPLAVIEKKMIKTPPETGASAIFHDMKEEHTMDEAEPATSSS